MKKSLVSKYAPMLPLMIFLVLIIGYPLILNIFYSLSDVTFETIRNPRLKDDLFQDYRYILKSEYFWDSFAFSIKFAFWATFFEVGIGLILALILEPLIRKHKSLLVFILLPVMIAPALIGIMYRLLLNEFVGLIPQYLKIIGINIDLLNPPWLNFTLLLIEILQWTPFVFLLIFAGLQGINQNLIDAANVDGANTYDMHKFVIIPLLIPFITISAFIRLVDSFRVFDHIYVLTGGGPGRLTTSMSIFIYKSFFNQSEISQAIAASIILMIIFLVPLIVSMKKIVRK